jgi:hypothetical protein
MGYPACNRIVDDHGIHGNVEPGACELMPYIEQTTGLRKLTSSLL